MAKLLVDNGTDKLMLLLVEPWGLDYWLQPDEKFTVRTEQEPDENPFDVAAHDEGMSVVVNTAGHAVVLDAEGRELACGHQRPDGWPG
jgi:hypothetical protein